MRGQRRAAWRRSDGGSVRADEAGRPVPFGGGRSQQQQQTGTKAPGGRDATALEAVAAGMAGLGGTTWGSGLGAVVRSREAAEQSRGTQGLGEVKDVSVASGALAESVARSAASGRKATAGARAGRAALWGRGGVGAGT